MRKSARLFVLALAVPAAFAASVASANTITAEPAGAITATSLGRLTFFGRGGIEISVSCGVVLRGSVNRTINDAREGVVGAITEGTASECSTGRARLLVEARSSWPLTLAEAPRLEGSPKLANINVGNAKFQFEEIFGQTCLYEGTLPTQLEGEGFVEEILTRLLRVLANSQRKVSGGVLCPTSGELRGEFSFTRQKLVAGSWSVNSESREDGAGRTVIRIEATRNGRGVTIASLNNPAGWTVTGLDCVRAFADNNNDRCRATATSQAGAGQATKRLLDGGGQSRLNLVLVP